MTKGLTSPLKTLVLAVPEKALALPIGEQKNFVCEGSETLVSEDEPCPQCDR